MKNIKRNCLACLCAAAVLGIPSLGAAESQTYQVTGPVLEVTPTTITVQKGNDKWEIGRDAKTKSTEDIKVGSRVTIHYTMTATKIEVKDAKAKKAGK